MQTKKPPLAGGFFLTEKPNKCFIFKKGAAMKLPKPKKTPAVWKWENEVSPPKYENLLAMAKLFGCSMDHVMGQDTIGA